MSKVQIVISELKNVNDRRFNRMVRMAALCDMNGFDKVAAEQHGVFQHFQGDIINYQTREQYKTQRGGEARDRDVLYGVTPEQEDTKGKVEESQHSLSTRYSPDRVGVQSRRVADGLVQDPYTNRTYDWREGFTTEDGREFSGGTVDLQTDIFSG